MGTSAELRRQLTDLTGRHRHVHRRRWRAPDRRKNKGTKKIREETPFLPDPLEILVASREIFQILSNLSNLFFYLFDLFRFVEFLLEEHSLFLVASLKIFQKSYSKSFSSLVRFLFRFCQILRPKADPLRRFGRFARNLSARHPVRVTLCLQRNLTKSYNFFD